jgi:predicted phosphodiesterase
LHLNPGELLEEDVDRLLGDVLEIIPWGMGVWLTPEGRATIESIAKYAKILVCGNHDHSRFVKVLFADFPELRIVDNYWEWDKAGNAVFYFHGDSFAPDWKWLRIGADDVTVFMTRWKWLRKIWWWYWSRDRKPRSQKNPERYSKWYWLTWKNGIERIQPFNAPATIYIGHTHYQSVHVVGNCRLVNLPAGEIVEI